MSFRLRRRWSMLLALLLLIPVGLTPPAAAEGDEGVIVYHETFTDGIGKTIQSGGASLQPAKGVYFEGNADGGALYVTNRQNEWDAADYYASSVPLLAGNTYAVTVLVYADPADLNGMDSLTIVTAVVRNNDSYREYAEAVIEPGKPATLTRTFTAEDGDKAFRIQTNAAGKTVPYYIGEIKFVLIREGEAPGGEDPDDVDKSGIFDDFESGSIGNWVRRFGSGGIDVTTKDNHTPGGRYSLITTADSQYDGPLLDLRGKLARGHQYELSAWVKMAPGEEPTVIRISVQYGETSYANVSQDVLVTSSEWVKLSGLYTQSVTPGEFLNAYVEVAEYSDGPRTFLIDDFELKYVGPVAGPNPDFSLPALKEVYKDRFPIGSIMNPGNFGDEVRSKMLKHHFNLLTAENAMKPEYAYKPGTREFDLNDEIALAEQAIANGFKVHGHVLVWHAQSPNWLHTQVDANGNPLRDANGNVLYLSKEEALHNLRTHIRTVVSTIGDRVISWDVVNEAMDDNPPNPADWRDSLRRSGWYYAIGPEYIYEAFKTAREVIDENGWDIELYYNDYNDDNQNKATAIANMVKELNEQYARETGSDRKLIDGIGMQAHYNLNTNPENVRASIERIIGIGVKIGITELDIMAGSGALSEELAIRQGQLYAQLFQLYKEYADHITRVTFWGVDDGTSWRSQNNPLLFDSRFQAKPAYYAVIDPDKFLEEHPPATKAYRKGTAAYGTPVVDGVEDEVWSRTEALPMDRFQMSYHGASGTAQVLWDEENLYVLFKVRDTELDHASSLPYEQDSVEVFFDETNSKAPSYGPGIGQYRVNYLNDATFNPAGIADGFESAVVVNGTDYIVEMKIPFRTITPESGHRIGFDAQVNDARDGVRRSVAIWNDESGQGWQDPSVFGIVTLVKAEEPGDGGGTTPPTPPAPPAPPAPSTPTKPAPEQTVDENGIVTIKPPVTTADGRAAAGLDSKDLSQALERAAADENGSKTIILDIEAEDADAVELELPREALDSDESYVLRLNTPFGTIEIPSNMLEGTAKDADAITIAVERVHVEELDEDVRDAIGDRPVIRLNVLADGEAIAWNNPNAPVTVSIPYEPTEAELANPERIVVWYIDGDGHVTAVPNGRYDAASGAVVFRTTHFSVYAVVHADVKFSDIGRAPWAKQAIEAMAPRGFLAAAGDSFRTHDPVSRAEFAAGLVRLLELQDTGKPVPVFVDLTKTHAYAAELRIALQHGIIRGTGKGLLQPDAPLTRQDMMVMVDQALTAAGRPQPAGGSLALFSDAGDVADYARSSAEKLAAAGIVVGSRGKLAPGSLLTRAEAAVVLHRIWSL